MLYQLSHFRSMNATTDAGGAESQDRTGDTAIFSRVLYQLSYLGPMANQARSPVGGAEDTTGPPRASTSGRPAPSSDSRPTGRSNLTTRAGRAFDLRMPALRGFRRAPGRMYAR